MVNRRETYDTPDVRRVLGYSSKVLGDLREEGGLLFKRKKSGRLEYDKQYIDAVAVKLAKCPPESRHLRDRAFFWLSAWQWQYRNPPRTLKGSRLNAYRKKLTDACGELVANGDAYVITDLAGRVGKMPENLYRWGWSGAIPVFAIGRQSYVSGQFGQYLITLFTKWLTIPDAANILGVSIPSLQGKVYRGEIQATMCPDSAYRINPTVVKSLQVDTRPAAPFSAVAAQLGVSNKTLACRVNADSVTATAKGYDRHVADAEVQRLTSGLKTLNEPFSWLQPLVVLPHRKPNTLHTARAARELGIATTTLGNWSKAGLIPFFPARLAMKIREERHFVELYVFGLRKFAGEGKVSRETAERYLALCKEKNCIV